MVVEFPGKTSGAAFAAFYEPWILDFPLAPAELPLSCEPCLMASPQLRENAREAGGSLRDRGPFRADLKCCTYMPFLPNFTIGALLEDGMPFAQFQDKRARLTPLGMLPHDGGSEKMGQLEEERCPFFLAKGGLCGIWRHRPGVCANYLCVSRHGKHGHRWRQTAEKYLNLFEWTFANALCWELGYTGPEVERAAVLDADFYRRVYERAREFSAVQIRELLDSEGEAILENLRASAAELSLDPKP